MTQSELAAKIGSQLAEKLQGVTDEKKIKALTVKAWKQLREAIRNPSSFSSRGLSGIRKVVKEAFPDSETPKRGYYHTTQGKGQVSRYEHLALWYLTANTDRWEVTGDEARQAYFNNLPELPKFEPQPETHPEVQPEAQPEAQTIKLEDMTLQQLELDTETQAIVENALAHSGMSLPDFIKQACRVYARTVVGKAEQANKTDLSSIPTSELLNPVIPEGKKKSTMATLPGRAEELARRAIVAITHHNDMATEKSQKWCLTGTAINALTGSKMTLIKNVMEQYKTMIDDHNSKHGLNPYDNRGRSTKIEEDIDFVNFSESVAPVTAAPKTTTPETTAPSAKRPEVKKTKLKIETMPVNSSALEIWEFLQQNPNTKARIKDGRKALHYLPVTDDNGNMTAMQIEETGEVIQL
ncbi:hypothetical protein F7734_54600 [Scytonema sp. UIC 10036]|uniref:hypothetical protein n=1 Tax=Scytonema sp. UIC 10036 TaxID=2304196 RepID=UPI0012DA3C19|nr:hypothetical protein [Scytonema sp. UIC 10036]MUH00830.1 hypothetical protein [Scytonema sp. UIC 10036]